MSIILRINHQSGFTLVELVLTIVILGILTAVAIPHFADVDDFKERTFADSSLAAVRYYQKLAISTGCDVLVDFNPKGSRPAEIYAVQHSSCDSPSFFTVSDFNSNPEFVTNPSGDNIPDIGGNPRFIVQAPADYDVASKDFFFDKVGRPHRDQTASPTNQRDYYTGQITIALTNSDGTVFNQLQIENDTGFSSLIGPP